MLLSKNPKCLNVKNLWFLTFWHACAGVFSSAMNIFVI